MHWIDPDCLPETKGSFERFVLNPHGEIDGLVLNGGKERTTLIHVPPHLSAAIETSIRPGEAVTVRGVRPRGADMVAAVALTTAAGHVIIDDGPDHEAPDRKDGREHRTPSKPPTPRKAELTGTVRLSLFAPKGELRGALLEDGSVVRIGPKEASRFAGILQPGAAIAVRGDAIETKHGRVVNGKEIGPSLAELRPVKNGKHAK